MPLKRTKILAWIALGTAFVLLSFFGFTLYTVYQKEAALSSLEAELLSARKEEEAVSSLKHLLADIKGKREIVDGYFIGSDGIVSFIESIEALSALARVEISVNSVGVEEAEGGDAFEYVTLNASAEGDFNNLYWLLSLIERMPLKLEVRQAYLDEKLPESEKDSGKFRLALVVTALKLK